MIEYNTFKDILSRAEKVLGYLSEDQRKIYWENTKGFPEETVRGAVGRVITTHGFYKFPTVAEFLDAVSDHTPLTGLTPHDDSCPVCAGVGRFVAEYWIGEGTYTKEVFCSCSEGQRQRRIRAEYLEKRRMGLTRADGSAIKKGSEHA